MDGTDGEAGLRDFGADAFHAHLHDVAQEKSDDNHRDHEEQYHADAETDKNFLFHNKGKIASAVAIWKEVFVRLTD